MRKNFVVAIVLVILCLAVSANCYCQKADTAYYVDSKELFDAINKYRKEHRRKEMIFDPERQKSADKAAKRIVKSFTHSGGPFCENLVKTYDSTRMLMLWQKSKGHNKNLLEKDVLYGCVSIYYQNGEYYAVFQGSRTPAPQKKI